MEYQKIFDNAKLLFEYFGWYSLLLVLGTTLIMIPVNLLYKKIMKKDTLERLRKTLSSITVYIIALGLIALFTHFVIKAPLTFDYLMTSCLSCGLLSMLLWAIIKFVRDYGVLPIINSILKSKEANKWLKEMGLSDKLISIIYSNIDKYCKDTNIVSLDDFIKNEANIINQITTQITGFISNDKINEAVNKISQTIKEKFKPVSQANKENG